MMTYKTLYLRCHYINMECAFCLLSVKNGTQTDCGHRFHKKCISQWVKVNNVCPLCRLVVTQLTTGKTVQRISPPLQSFETTMNIYHFGDEPPPPRPQRNLPGFVVSDSSVDESFELDNSEVSDVIITRRDDSPIGRRIRNRRHK
jgi:hypothetical protein